MRHVWPRRSVLEQTDFGSPVAEQEAKRLAAYWVDTSQWRNVLAGGVDIVYGPKGSGKSALYVQLLNSAEHLRSRNVHVIEAENPQGATAFRSVLSGTELSERELISLWKVYFLSLVGEHLRACDVPGQAARTVIKSLADAGLILPDVTLVTRLRAAWEYVGRFLKPKSVETGFQGLDPVSWLPRVTFKIEPSDSVSEGARPVEAELDELLGRGNQALQVANVTVWLLLDRLDVAFADSPVMETKALRALFRVYSDLANCANLCLKIFLRTDIWNAITGDKGFRESSHFVRSTTLKWDPPALGALLIRRALDNRELRGFYRVVDVETALSPFGRGNLFSRIFPAEIDGIATFTWMLNQTRDGQGNNAPRELIELVNEAKKEQLRAYDHGAREPEGEGLVSRMALIAAYQEVSRIRLEQTLYAENPDLKPFVQALEGRATSYTAKLLGQIWQIPEQVAAVKAELLVGATFFSRLRSGEYEVPPLYRYALRLR